jgi:hypothetical protein
VPSSATRAARTHVDRQKAIVKDIVGKHGGIVLGKGRA